MYFQTSHTNHSCVALRETIIAHPRPDISESWSRTAESWSPPVFSYHVSLSLFFFLSFSILNSHKGGLTREQIKRSRVPKCHAMKISSSRNPFLLFYYLSFLLLFFFFLFISFYSISLKSNPRPIELIFCEMNAKCVRVEFS